MDNILQEEKQSEFREITNEESNKYFLELIEKIREPFASEFRAILEKYPNPCKERADLVTDAINRSYEKL